MPIKIIGKTVRDKAEALLSDQVTGFNPVFASEYRNFGLSSPVSIDFMKQTNFYRTQVAWKSLDDTSCFSYPVMMLYVKNSYNKRHQKFNVFSGDVIVFIEVWFSFSPPAVPKDTEKYLDATESVLVHIFNSVASQGTWDLGTVYNGDIRCERSPIGLGGPSSFVQGLIATLVMQTHTG